MPLNLAREYNGWTNRKIIGFYENYVRTVFKRYKDKVKYWLTFNEVNSVLHAPFMLGGIATPMEGLSKQELYQAVHHELVGSASITKIGHEIKPERTRSWKPPPLWWKGITAKSWKRAAGIWSLRPCSGGDFRIPSLRKPFAGWRRGNNPHCNITFRSAKNLMNCLRKAKTRCSRSFCSRDRMIRVIPTRFINVRPSLAYFIKRKAIPFSQISF